MITTDGLNIVIVAHNFNPTIFTPIWLVNIKAIKENELIPNTIVTPAASNNDTSDFNLLVMPDRLQLTFKREADFKSIIEKTLHNIVKSLPHTPYEAVGFNFIWSFVPDNQGSFRDITYRYFISDKNPLKTIFDQQDARFGIYMSKNALDLRLKLDIKPVYVTIDNISREALQFIFNFHKDLDKKTDSVEILLTTIDKWLTAKSEAEKIVKELSEKWGM